VTTIENTPTLRRPETLEQLSSQIAHANNQGRQVRIVGSNSAPWTRFDPARPIDNLCTLRLNKVIEHAVADMTVIVQAGISLEALQKQLAWQNQWLPVDPPAIGRIQGGTGRTIGGLIASNALGSTVLGYGDWRQLVLGMRWIDAAGTLTKGGSRTVKNVAGYATPRMMIGSTGTLGAIAEVTLRTYPRPTDERSLIVFCPTPQHAEDVIAAALLAPALPKYIQVIGRAAFAKNPLELPTDRILVAIGFLDRPELCDTQIEVVRNLPAITALECLSQNAAQSARLRLWMSTEPAGQFGFRLHAMSSQVTGLIATIEGLAEQAGGTAWLVSEAVQGVLRGSISAVADAPALYHQLENLAKENNAALILTAAPAEFPIAPGKTVAQGDTEGLFTRLKSQLDPHNTFGHL